MDKILNAVSKIYTCDDVYWWRTLAVVMVVFIALVIFR